MKILISICLFLCFKVEAAKIKIATLEWPPYTCENCPGGGITTKILRDQFKANGIKAEFEFFPWARASKLVEKGDFDALWPCWPDEVKSLKLEESSVIFTSPISFVGLSKNISRIKKMSDLADYRLGSVTGYGYNEEFRALLNGAKKGNQIVVNDQMNIEKLMAGRVDYIAIDLVNFRYIMHTKMAKTRSSMEAIPFIKHELPLIFGIHKKDKKLFDRMFGDKNYKNIMNQKIAEELKIIFSTPPKNAETSNFLLKPFLSFRDDFLTGERGTGELIK